MESTTGTPGANLGQDVGGMSNDVGNVPENFDAGQGEGLEQAGVEGNLEEQVEQTPDYGGFESIEELVNAYGQTQEQVRNLESLKGQHGTRIGELQQRLAEMEGQLAAFQSMNQTQGGQQPGFAEIVRRYEDNDQNVTLDHVLAAYKDQVVGEILPQVQSEINTIKTEAQREKYAEQFIQKNPDYVDAYNNGNLNPFMQQGASAEQAYFMWKTQELGEQLKAKESEKAQAEQAAREQGRKAGAQIEKGKTQAGRVLGTGSAGQGTFRNQQKPSGGLSYTQQLQQGRDLLNRIRSQSAG
jgi:hypothetical protein